MKSVPASLALFALSLSALNLKAASMFLAPESDKLKRVANIAATVSNVIFLIDGVLAVAGIIKRHKKPASEE